MGTTQQSTTFQMGDKVVHAGMPEWGVGVVSTSAATEHEGTPCQRLVIRFDRAGLKTLSTGVADIHPATDQVTSNHAQAAAGRHVETKPLDAPQPKNKILDATPQEVQEIMARIPDAARDPFATPAMRLEATLKLYKYDSSGAPLIEWAVMQSGLSDPLSKFSRHELEEHHSFFARRLDKHLAEQVRSAGTIPQEELVRIARGAPPRGQQALRRIHAKR